MADLVQNRSGGWIRSQVLVLGLDLGTTSFKIGMLAVDEKLDSLNTLRLAQTQYSQIKVLENYPEQRLHSATYAPVCLYYGSNGGLSEWGYPAEKIQGHPDFDSDFFVTNWKIALHESSDPRVAEIRRRLQLKARALGKGGLEAFGKDFAEALDDYLFEDSEESPISKIHQNAIDRFSHIDVVIAVPPGWPRHEHEQLSTAIAEGLGEKRSYRIFRASETECVLMSWMQDPLFQANSGEILMLVDLGGGTACISAFRREVTQNGELTWTHMESHSLSAGSELVSEEFEKDFRQRLVGVTDVDITPNSMHIARVQFDEVKGSIGRKNTRKDLLIKVPGLKRNTEKDFLENFVYFSSERLLGYFQPSQDQILRKIGAMTDRIARDYGTPPRVGGFYPICVKCSNIWCAQYCLTAGAYANNVLFRRKLNETNHHNMIITLIPNNADAVARGACLTRVYGNFNQFIGGTSKHSIGILTYIKEEQAKTLYPFPARRNFDRDKTKYSPAILWAIRKGDTVQQNHVVAESGSDLRWRTFEEGEDMNFTDTLFISDSEISQDDEYTVLRFSTTTSPSWQANMANLRYRGVTGSLYEVTWTMKKVLLKNRDGSSAGFCNHENLGIDASDPKKHNRRKILSYRVFIHVSSTDIKVAFQTSHPGGLTGYLIADQKKIEMSARGEFESTALQKEYDNIGVGDEMSQVQAKDSEDYQISQQLVTTPSRTIQSSPRSSIREPSSTTSESSVAEAVHSETTQAPPICITQPRGASSIRKGRLGGDSEHVISAEYTRNPQSTPITQERSGGTARLQTPSRMPESVSRISSRLRTRSSTPVGMVCDPAHQSSNKIRLLEPQTPGASPRAAKMRGEPQSSLRTPVVPAKKRRYEFLSDEGGSDDSSDGDDDKDDDWIP